MTEPFFPQSLEAALDQRQIADWVLFISEVGREQIGQILRKGMRERHPVGNSIEAVRKVLDRETLPDAQPSHCTIPNNRHAALIIHQEMGYLYALAKNIRHGEACKYSPELKKVWVQSGNTKEPNDGHVSMHGQIVSFNEAFCNPVTGKLINYPRDPAADIAETFNCSCDTVLYRPLYGPLGQYIGPPKGRNLHDRSVLEYDPVSSSPTEEELVIYKLKVIAILGGEPGLVQSKLYERFGLEEKDKVGYAISSLKRTGAIYRENRGRSFALWLSEGADQRK
ncbi:MAG: hypothetical protein LZF86_110344 [Nitrospira sp.]|nr:MAG: hypothetical protein LZF86_110344 [Nitrospira sp.]